MDYASTLSVLASWAAILTAVVAVVAYWQFIWLAVLRRRRLEAYLKSVRDEGQGQKTVLHLMRELRMTEDEVMSAGLHSRKVTPRVTADGQGLADKLLFEYAE